jgi:hypothetical protein
MMKILIIYLLIAYPVFMVTADGGDDYAKERLLKSLLQGYTPFVNPGAIQLKIGFAPMCITYDEQTSVATVNGWDSYAWTDRRLQWDPEEHSGLTSIEIPAKLIWTPDVRNYFETRALMEREMGIYTVVSSTGEVIFIPPTTYKNYCQRDTTDQIICTLRLGSWVYDESTVDLVTKPDGSESSIDMSNYNPACPMVVTNHTAEIKKTYYTCCPNGYPIFDMTFNIQRRGH